MKKDLINRLIDPLTNENFKLEITNESYNEIRSGRLFSMNNTYPIEEGVINLLSNDDEYAFDEMKHKFKGFDEMKKEYGKNFDLEFEKQVLGLDEPNNYDLYTRNTMDEFLGNQELKNSTILEIGGSTGRDLQKYFGGPTNELIELDINPFLGKASSILIDRNNHFYERIRCNMNKLPFKSETFDIVFGSATFHHVEDPSIVFEEVHRVLKPGGKFFVLNERVLSVLRPELKQQVSIEMEDAHEHAFFTKEWIFFLKKCGFHVDKVRPAYFDYARIFNRVYNKKKPTSLSGRIRYNYYYIMLKLMNKSKFQLLHYLEDSLFANVPFNAIATKD